MGLLWMLGFLIFEVVAVMFYLDIRQWWIYGTLGVVLSQTLIILYWNDTKFGTIVNILILFVILMDFGTWHFRKNFLMDVNTSTPTSMVWKK